MKRYGLRVLTLAVMAFALIGVAGLAADVEDIAYNEAIPEISAAAGLVLGAQWAEAKTVDEVNILAESARNGAIVAVETALALLTGQTEEELYALEDAEILALAEAGDVNAATVYFFKNRRALKQEEQLREFAADLTGDVLLAAAAEHLAGIYLGFQNLTEAELLVLVESDDSLTAAAAAIAVAQIWAGTMPMTAYDVQVLLTEITGTNLAAAYQAYLIYLYSQ